MRIASDAFRNVNVGCVGAVALEILFVSLLAGILSIVGRQIVEGGPVYQTNDATHGTP